MLRDYYDCLDYLEKDDWDLAIETIKYCVSDSVNYAKAQEFRHQWQERIDLYSMIGNHFAVDASQKLVNSIVLT